MPVKCTIDHSAQLVHAVCGGVLTLDDVVALFDQVIVSEAKSYRKIVELRRTESTITDDQRHLIGARIQAYKNYMDGPMGPIAIVVTTEGDKIGALFFRALGAANRAVEIFHDLESARLWLHRMPEA
ncbi:MAG: hypothetical protein JSR90_08140 [Proteobacteria bacterium]|nr:hypothetical protein [Pseudomonadota bacterium]